ncbi:MAG: hypothetical protein HOV80_05590 [Polyangiaceae bacterium]|nr:hypothetical protein [Polyangiaceae bacterium]
MLQRQHPLWLLILAVAACDSEVARTPKAEEQPRPPTPPGSPLVQVEVLGPRDEPVEAFDVLVHTFSGELRSRYLSKLTRLDVEAEPGDFISVIWYSEEAESPAWRLESARITSDVDRVRFQVGTPTPTTNPNAPIRLEVAQALVPGVDRYAVHADCADRGWQLDSVYLELDDYVGCPSSPSSLVVGMGRDENLRLLTFDAKAVPHVPEATATILFPSTPVQRETNDLTVSAAPEWSSASLFDGSVQWKEPRQSYSELIDGLPADALVLPATLSIDMPLLPIGETAAVFGALLLDPPEGEPFCHVASLSMAHTRTWDLTRLRRAVLSADYASVRMLPPRDDGSFHETGDAISISLDGARMWIPVPEGTYDVPLPVLQMPDDLPQTFGPLYIGHFGAHHLDGLYEDGYAEYLARGIGQTRSTQIEGEQLLSQSCAGP